MIKLTIPGRPVPKGRPRVVGRRAYTPAKTKQAEAKIAVCALAQGIKPIAGCVMMMCIFHYKGKGHADCDNLLKLVADAGQGIFYENDRQILDLRGTILLQQKEEKTEILIGKY